MLEEQKILILEYLLKNEGAKVIITIPNEQNIPNDLHELAIEELKRNLYIKNTVAGYKILDRGKSYLTKAKHGLFNDNVVLNIGNTHISGNNNIVNSASIDSNNTVNQSLEKPKNPLKKWGSAIIIGLIVTVVGGLILYLLTKS